MNKKKLFITLSLFLIMLLQLSLVSSTKLASNTVPSAAILGRYVIWDDMYWFITNRTIQQLLNEGYGVSGDPNQLVQVNYTRLNYTFKNKIVKIAWPNVTVEIIEGGYDINLTVHKIFENGTIGEKLGSFLRAGQPAKEARTYETWSPSFGIGFDPSFLRNGSTLSLQLTYNVTGPETLLNTPWGQNKTYVLSGEKTNITYSVKNRVWCDAQTGIILKQIFNVKMPSVITYEEQFIREIGVEEVSGKFPDFILIIGILTIVIVVVILVYFIKIK